MIKAYYALTKPGIIYGNAITAAGGFLLASRGQLPLGLFVAMLIGISLVIASACVFNNYIDRDIDKEMGRTKNRPLVKGTISGPQALLYGAILGIAGVIILGRYTNLLTTIIAIAGFLAYVVLYGVWKRRSVHGTVVGSISGAVPPVVGYCAVSNRLDAGALILFLILVLWQMPHFYAIAIYRSNDYAAAQIPVLPLKKGLSNTKVQILAYIIAFIIATFALTLYGYAGYTYLVIIGLLGLRWLWLGLQGFKIAEDKVNENKIWARKVFHFSLIIITALSVMIPLGVVLP